MKLSATKVKNAKPGPKTQRLFDGGGMYLEITPKGQKYWRLKYRIGGKEKRISLGVYPDVSLAEARGKREKNRKLIAKNEDPSQLRKEKKIEEENKGKNTLSAVAYEWLEKMQGGWAKSYSEKVEGRINVFLRDTFGERPIADLKAPELLQLVQAIEKSGRSETAHRVLRMYGQIFRYAIATGRAERDLSADLRGALAPAKKTHMAAITNPAKFGELLRAIDVFKGTLVVECALRLAPLVFVRPGELRGAQWADIDLEKGEWRFDVSKTASKHIVPLSRQAVEILRDIEPLTGNGRFVFTNGRTHKERMSEGALLGALRRMGIEKSETSVHGFRATARTLLDEELGFRVDYIEHQLAHAVRDPNGRAYNRTKFLPERKKMMQAWADYLDQLKTDSNVIPLRAKNHTRT